MNKTVFLKDNYKQQLMSISKEVSEKYRALEKAYDMETEHSKNRAQQWKWDQQLKDELVRWKTGSETPGTQ